MGYLPRPTTLICSECGLIEATENPKQMGQRLSELSRTCPHPKRLDDPANCSWGQLDVIFAHWSGSWKSASPNMTIYDQTSRRPIKRFAVCGKCGSRQFVLNKDQVALSIASRVGGVSAEHVAVVRRSLLAAGIAVQGNFETRWTSSSDDLKNLAQNLLGVASYIRAHHDRDSVQLVLTEPGQKSALRRAIDDSRALSPVVFQTSDAFFSLARAAKEELTVLSPFLDQQGADFLAELFALCSRGVRRILICRPLDEPECGNAFWRHAADFRRLGVSIYEYALPSLLPSGRETFMQRSFWPTHPRSTWVRATLWDRPWTVRLSAG
jgi:hypothetical protein